MERRQARTMRIYSERVWKKVFLTVSIPVTLCVLLYLIGIDWGFWKVTPIWLLMLAGMIFMHKKGNGYWITICGLLNGMESGKRNGDARRNILIRN